MNVVHAIDMDGDGDIDVVAQDGVASVWYENDGSENFTEHQLPSIAGGGDNCFAVLPLDVDGDGDIDIIEGIRIDPFSGTLRWLENDGEETFSEHIIVEEEQISGIWSSDVDRDGDMDILALYENSEEICILYLNDGAQNFTQNIIASHGHGSWNIYTICMIMMEILIFYHHLETLLVGTKTPLLQHLHLLLHLMQ